MVVERDVIPRVVLHPGVLFAEALEENAKKLGLRNGQALIKKRGYANETVSILMDIDSWNFNIPAVARITGRSQEYWREIVRQYEDWKKYEHEG